MEQKDIIKLTEQLYGINSDFINHLAELRKMDKKVLVGEVKDYGNGIPKTWDDENF